MFLFLYIRLLVYIQVDNMATEFAGIGALPNEVRNRNYLSNGTGDIADLYRFLSRSYPPSPHAISSP